MAISSLIGRGKNIIPSGKEIIGAGKNGNEPRINGNPAGVWMKLQGATSIGESSDALATSYTHPT